MPTTVEKPDGVWWMEGRIVLSEVRHRPGPTHSIFDVLAASAAVLSTGDTIGLLGFGAGGAVAPLAALGFGGLIDAVDLSMRGEALFRRVSDFPVDHVRVERGDALEWLRGKRPLYDAVVEDLSEPHETYEVIKPEISLNVLPQLIAHRVRPGGVAIFNSLPTPGWTWRSIDAKLRSSFAELRWIRCDDFDNRVALAADSLPSAAECSRRIRAALSELGSRQASRISVRSR